VAIYTDSIYVDIMRNIRAKSIDVDGKITCKDIENTDGSDTTLRLGGEQRIYFGDTIEMYYKEPDFIVHGHNKSIAFYQNAGCFFRIPYDCLELRRITYSLVDVIPKDDNKYNMGDDTHRWALVRAVTVTSGDLNLKSDKGDWTIKEDGDKLIAVNNRTGKKYRILLEEVKE